MSDEKLQAFTAPDPEVGGITMRPFTAMSLILLRQTGNRLLDGVEAEGIEYDVAAFLYIHTAPRDQVLAVAADKGKFQRAVLEYADGLTLGDFTKAAKEIRRQIEGAMAGQDYQVEDQENSGN